DPKVPIYYHTLFERSLPVVVGVQLVVFVSFGFYNRWWRYVSTRDMWGAARGVTVACLLSSLVVYVAGLVPHVTPPRSVLIMDWLLLLAFGAGDAGHLIVKEMLRQPALGYTPIGLVDDDPKTRNLRVHGIRVLGTTDDLPAILREQRPDEVLIAIPSAPGSVRGKVVQMARREGIVVKTLPGLHELIAGDVDLAGQIRPVQVEDVLGREPVEVDLQAIASYLAGETVLVSGAGGSIGSELCRQIARLGAARIVLVDHSERALFEIERELVDERSFPAAYPVLADIGNRAKMRQVFERYRPGVVFHAAAYKHVPLMEANPIESVRNNALATRSLAEVAAAFGTKRFVLVSTDKAAN